MQNRSLCTVTKQDFAPCGHWVPVMAAGDISSMWKRHCTLQGIRDRELYLCYTEATEHNNKGSFQDTLLYTGDAHMHACNCVNVCLVLVFDTPQLWPCMGH